MEILFKSVKNWKLKINLLKLKMKIFFAVHDFNFLVTKFIQEKIYKFMSFNYSNKVYERDKSPPKKFEI